MELSHSRVFFALVFIVLVAPIWVVEIPPLVDLPNHAARISILANYDDSKFFREHFEVLYEPIPNMGMDMLLMPLAELVGIWTAFKIFLSLIVVLFVVGCQLIAGVLHKNALTFTSLVAPFLLYGSTLFYGYLNYLLSVALFLICFGLWLRWRDSLTALRFLFLSVLVFAVYLSHLSSFAFLGLAIVLYNLYQTRSKGPKERSVAFWLADASLFLAPAIAFLTFIRGSGSVGTLEWEGFRKKLVVSIGPLLSYDNFVDIICYGAVLGFIAWLLFRKRIVVNRSVLFVSLSFFLLFFVAPTSLFTAGDADARIVLPAYCLLILSIDSRSVMRDYVPIAILILALLGFRQVMIGDRWHQMSSTLTNAAQIYDKLPANSFVYVTYGQGYLEDTPKTERIKFLSIGLATIDRGVIWPRLFAIRGQQPLVFRRTRQTPELSIDNIDAWDEILSEYDHVWAFKVSDDVRKQLLLRGSMIAETNDMILIKIKDRSIEQ